MPNETDRKSKHLVLDGDVHSTLKERRAQTGRTIKEIGNEALRASLRLPSHHDLVLRHLLESGKVTARDCEEVLATVANPEARPHPTIEELFRSPTHQSETMVHGSWAAREMACAPDRSWQLIEAWGRDNRSELSVMHVYRNTHAYGVVLCGKLLVDTDGETRVFAAPEMFHLSVGTLCATAPLSTTTKILLTFVPAVMGPRPAADSEKRSPAS